MTSGLAKNDEYVSFDLGPWVWTGIEKMEVDENVNSLGLTMLVWDKFFTKPGYCFLKFLAGLKVMLHGTIRNDDF